MSAQMPALSVVCRKGRVLYTGQYRRGLPRGLGWAASPSKLGGHGLLHFRWLLHLPSLHLLQLHLLQLHLLPLNLFLISPNVPVALLPFGSFLKDPVLDRPFGIIFFKICFFLTL